MAPKTTVLDPNATTHTGPDWLARPTDGEPVLRTVELLGRWSRTGHRPYWDRFDPYYALEAFARPIHWRLHGTKEVQERVDDLGLVRKMLVDVPTTETGFDDYLEASMVVRRIVALLGSYHVLTSQQLAAFNGGRSEAVAEALRRLYRAGLVYRGRLATGGSYNAPAFYKLNVDRRLSGWLRELDDTETLKVTAGDKFSRAPLYDRHNILAAELGLRAAEVHGDLQVVFGENLANPGLLLPGSAPTPARGDLVLVRGDGLRIVVELVQESQTGQLEEKMTRWGHLLGDADWHTNGVVVVFVAASRRSRKGNTRVLKAHTKALTANGLGTAGVPASATKVARARAAIHVASWEDWFPQPWRVSADFADLVTAVSPDGTTWRRVELGHGGPGGMPFTPAAPDTWLEVGQLGRELYQVPAWLGEAPKSTVTLPADLPAGHRPTGTRNRLADGPIPAA